MVKFVIARQLSGKNVITNTGVQLGKIVDIEIDDKTGKILSFLIDLDPDSKLSSSIPKEGHLGVINYDAVTAASDVIIVDERNL